MTFDRLADVQGILTGLYEQLAGEENAWLLAEEAEKARIKQKIRLTWQRIREYDREYAQQLSQQVKRQDVPEPVAEVVVAELADAIEILEPSASRDEVREMLREILTELRRPDTPAAAKLKVVIPIIPNLVSYELEGDTESVVRRLFPTFVKVYEAISPKK
jgi:AcrR family transcriptional regulator